MTTWKTLGVNFTTAYDAHTLEGLPGVSVQIHLDEDDALAEADALGEADALAEDDARDELTVETLQTDVEFQLRLAGIRVLTEDERLLAPSCPVLAVAVGIVAVRGLTGIHGFALTVGLYQMVTLTGGLRVSAETWNMGHAGFAPSAQVRTLLRKQVKDKIVAFVDAWLTVNAFK